MEEKKSFSFALVNYVYDQLYTVLEVESNICIAWKRTHYVGVGFKKTIIKSTQRRNWKCKI